MAGCLMSYGTNTLDAWHQVRSVRAIGFPDHSIAANPLTGDFQARVG
jgi:hypothetical protein